MSVLNPVQSVQSVGLIAPAVPVLDPDASLSEIGQEDVEMPAQCVFQGRLDNCIPGEFGDSVRSHDQRTTF